MDWAVRAINWVLAVALIALLSISIADRGRGAKAAEAARDAAAANNRDLLSIQVDIDLRKRIDQLDAAISNIAPNKMELDALRAEVQHLRDVLESMPDRPPPTQTACE